MPVWATGGCHNVENERRRKRRRKKDASFRKLVSPTHMVTDSITDEKLRGGGGGKALFSTRFCTSRSTTKNQRKTMSVMSSSKIQAEVRKVENRRNMETESKRKVEA